MTGPDHEDELEDDLDGGELAPALEAVGLSKSYGIHAASSRSTSSSRRGRWSCWSGRTARARPPCCAWPRASFEPTAGLVRIDGFDAGSLDARAALSYLPDNPVLYDDLSLVEHLHFIGRLHGVSGDEVDERGTALMERFNLMSRADDLPVTFSRGLRQKTSIALGLIRPFSVLLIDEPFVGLDQPGKRALTELIVDAHQLGATVIVATHALEFTEVAKRCIGLRDGELAYDGGATAEDVERLVS